MLRFKPPHSGGAADGAGRNARVVEGFCRRKDIINNTAGVDATIQDDFELRELTSGKKLPGKHRGLLEPGGTRRELEKREWRLRVGVS